MLPHVRIKGLKAKFLKSKCFQKSTASDTSGDELKGKLLRSHPRSAKQTIFHQNGAVFIWLFVYLARHNQSEWTHIQTLQKAFQKLVSQVLLELPLRMSPSKHTKSPIQKSRKLTGHHSRMAAAENQILYLDFHVFLSLPGQPNTHTHGFSVARSGANYRFTTVNIFICFDVGWVSQKIGNHFFETQQQFLPVMVVWRHADVTKGVKPSPKC